MRINEVNNAQSKLEKIKHFAEWAMTKLSIKDRPDIEYSNDISKVKKRRTFGSTRSDGTVWVHVGDRNAADTMRTLVHELVHVKQFQDGTATDDMDEDQRQFVEDEANALAGRLMRQYGKLDASIYESKSAPKPCCVELKQALLKHKKTDYDSIDKIMTTIAKKHSITGSQLHDYWVDQYKVTPDNWIKAKLKTVTESTKEDDLIDRLIMESLNENNIKGSFFILKTAKYIKGTTR